MNEEHKIPDLHRVTWGEMGLFCDIFINYSKHMALLSCFNDGSEH